MTRAPVAAWKLLLVIATISSSYLAPPPAWSDPPRLPQALQQRVHLAIDDGVRYLKGTQAATGTWATKESHRAGYAALPGLTLLECGVSAKDPAVQRAAYFVRAVASTLDTTYELALSILFLDRLSDKKDRQLIHVLALRLIAGQTATGGWGYKCPILASNNHNDLLDVLRKLPSPPLFNPLVPKDQASGLAGAPESTHGVGKRGWCIKLSEGRAPEPAKPAEPPAKKPSPKRPVTISPQLAVLPVLHDPAQLRLVDPEKKSHAVVWSTTDNSNTQFAILALWAARKHDVPMTRTVNLIALRFHTSQNKDGAWGYRYRYGGGEAGSSAMTCVGLLGLAVAHGLAREVGAAPAQAPQDPRIVHGFLALSRHIGNPTGDWHELPMANLYFLWSVERVGVLYNLPSIGDKDWYRWGAEILVANQQRPGNWDKGGYPGASPTLDTCLALLFLKRANLTQDLAERLPFNPAELSKEIDTLLPIEKKPASTPLKSMAKLKPPAVDATLKLANPLLSTGAAKSFTHVTLTGSSTVAPLGPAATDEEAGEGSGGILPWLVAVLGLLLLLIAAAFLLARRQRSEQAEEHPRERHAKRRRPKKEVVG